MKTDEKEFTDYNLRKSYKLPKRKTKNIFTSYVEYYKWLMDNVEEKLEESEE